MCMSAFHKYRLLHVDSLRKEFACLGVLRYTMQYNRCRTYRSARVTLEVDYHSAFHIAFCKQFMCLSFQ